MDERFLMSKNQDSPLNARLEKPNLEARFNIEHPPGETVFAFVCLGVGLFLLFQVGAQTRWVGNVSWLVQPRFWPGLSLVGFFIFAGGYFILSLRRHQKIRHNVFVLRAELFHWVRPVEYALYFIGYVYLVPWLGYLPATLLVFPALVFRAGYRRLKYLLLALVIGTLTVVVFKSLLRVRIPGGRLYEALPEQLRNFMLLHF